MTITCPAPCGRPVHDGYLCHRCTATLAETIRSAPGWADQLLYVLARLTRYSDPQGHRTGPAPLPYNPAATAPAHALDAALRAAARACGAPPEVQYARLGVVSAWLTHHMDVFRGMVTAPAHDAAITRAIETAMVVADRPPEHWYAGSCPGCGKDLYPLVTDEIVKCECGRAWGVEAKRTELLRKARAQVAPGPAIARALTTLGEPVTTERLRKWRHRGLLQVRRMTKNPPTNWYRVGDVMDLVANEAARRSRRKQA